MFVETNSLSKNYGRLSALRDCTFGVEAGEVFGLLGPNGAGKTTLLRLLMGFLRPTRGTAKIDGLDCCRDSVLVRRRVSYLPGDARLFRQMRGRDLLAFFSQMRPKHDPKRAEDLAKRLDLNLSRRVAMMSTGMRQKLALAVALAAETPLVILDEPTNNLDPTVRAVVMNLVSEAQAAGRTVIFSSHVMAEVEETCDRVAILRGGRLVHMQIMAELRRRHRITAVVHGTMSEPPEHLRDELLVEKGSRGRVKIETPGELAPLLGWLAELPLKEMRIEPVGLRAVYDQFHSEPASS